MKEIKFKGSYYDIGFNNGKQLIAEKEKGFPPKFSQENLEKSKAYEKELKKFTPDLLEELRGVADGCGVDYQKILAFEFTPYRNEPQCLVFCITGKHTKSGKPLFVRNHEWLEEDSTSLRVMNVKPNNKLASYGFTFCWSLSSRYGGINEAGLAISGATASFQYTSPGVMVNAAIRWILDNFKTTEEAVKFIKEMPKVWGMNYLIIDRNGTIAKLETHKEKTIVNYPKDFDMVTMTYESAEMRKLNPNESANKLELFDIRKKFLDNWFAENKGSITEESIYEILRDCENKLHYHIKAPNGTYGTCWSWIVSPKSDTALISLGPPCKNEFSQYTIDYNIK
ncbi:MAG: hypothetical protein KGD59_04470 [Candidatus Heimdallarchaeota archaeon]|nr:hypothetical protein [Candidatus Heimdallarchaeota archaeon]MBY8993781.1 hypothetical protein [Candidatus Heimdallarchaeota archaeon]